MNALLFVPQQDIQKVTVNGFTGIQNLTLRHFNSIAGLLGCLPGLVDVLATGSDFIAFSIFDFEGGYPNEAGMRELARLTGVELGCDDDTIILGPLLIIQQPESKA